MKRRAYAVQRDANEPEIVEALQKVGATVERLNFVDLAVGFRKQNYLLEVKTAKGKLTPDQKKLFPRWKGDIRIVRTKIEALQAIGALRSE